MDRDIFRRRQSEDGSGALDVDGLEGGVGLCPVHRRAAVVDRLYLRGEALKEGGG